MDILSNNSTWCSADISERKLLLCNYAEDIPKIAQIVEYIVDVQNICIDIIKSMKIPTNLIQKKSKEFLSSVVSTYIAI